MFAAGAALVAIGYALIWTGVQRFRGNKYSLLSALGVTGGGEVTPTAGDQMEAAQRQALSGQGGTSQAPPATGTPIPNAQQGQASGTPIPLAHNTPGTVSL